jgi:hypothetical protein
MGSCTWGTMGHLLQPKKFEYGSVPSSDKRLENHVPHIGYGTSTPS